MAMINAFTPTEKTNHNSHKFAFKLSPTNYGFWKSMIHPFLVTNRLYGYVEGSIPCPLPKTAATLENPSQDNPSYLNWITNDAHIRMLLISTISEASFQHVQGITSRDLWLALERAYAPHNSSREYTLKTQLLKLEMKGDESSAAYLARAQEYATALANIGESFKDKDIVMLVIAGLRNEYNSLKANLLARSPPITFNELHGILSDHDYMITKTLPTTPQAFTAATHQNSSTAHLTTLQQLAKDLGYQISSLPTQTAPPQAFYTNQSIQNHRGSSRGNSRGTLIIRKEFNNYVKRKGNKGHTW